MDLFDTLLDNTPELKVVDKIKEVITKHDIKKIMIASGYWDLPGTALIVKELKALLGKDGTNIKLLIGKDPSIYYSQLEKDPKYVKKNYPGDYFTVDINSLEVKEEYQAAVKFLIDYSKATNSDGSPKLEIHKFNKEAGEVQFLHSKCYIFTGSISFGIIGSSNFTQKGLEGNAELNWFTTKPTDIHSIPDPENGNPVKGYKYWFDEKWALSEDWTREFILEVIKNKGNKNLPQYPDDQGELCNAGEPELKIVTPYEAYIMTLIDQFGSVLDSDGRIKESDYLPKDPDFKILKYQTEAVNQGFAIMKKHGGFILGDVVGLGKTFTAVMIIKRYLLSTAFSKPVLVITPPSVKKSWIDSIEYFDKDSDKEIAQYINITTIGCLDADYMDGDSSNADIDDFDSAFDKGEYGLIVVDESHRFRNKGTQMYDKLDDLIAEVNPYVVLLSATPQNNRPDDLKNQIYLFQREPKNSTLSGLGEHGNNLESFFAQMQREYDECIRDYKGKDANNKKILKTRAELEADKIKLNEISEQIREYVVDQIVIRRTRTDLKKYYADDLERQGLVFPRIMKPEGIGYEMTGEIFEIFAKSLGIIAPTISRAEHDETYNMTFDFRDVEKECLGYWRYRAIEMFKDEKNKKLYEYNSKSKRHAGGTIKADNISKRLAGLMELLLVKRLESSKDAFEESLNNFIVNTQIMLDMFKSDRVYICPDLKVNEILSEENVKKLGSFEACLDDLQMRADRINKKKNTEHNRVFKAKDFDDKYVELLSNDIRLATEVLNSWLKNRQDPKMDMFIRKLDTYLDKKKNKKQKVIIFTECIATQKALVQKFADCAPEYKVLSITAANRKDMEDVIASNFDANYKGTKRNDYNILVTTDVLAEGVNLHEANTLINYDSPWNATTLMQRLGRINRIGSPNEKIYSYNFYPSTTGDAQINLYKRTLVKLQAFHNLFGEDSQIYTTEEELKEHKLVEHETEDSESPNMQYIAELKQFYTEHKDKYEKLQLLLSSISVPVYSAVLDTNAHDTDALVLMHKTNTAGEYIDSSLYKYNTDRHASMSQTEFVELFKTYSKQNLYDIDTAEYTELFDKACKNYEIELANTFVKTKNNTRAGEKDKKSAKTIIKNIYSIFDDRGSIDDSLQAKFNKISDSINDGNRGVVNHINKMNLEAKEDLKKLMESVDYLYNMSRTKSADVTGQPAITFIIK